MLNKIRQKFQSEDRKRLLENFFSLSVLQGANYILPLITLPYLVRVLGPEKFGLIAFAQSFIQYFNILTDYGFNLSATREISIHREDKKKVSEIFSAVMLIKCGLLFLSLVILTIIVSSFNKFKQDWEIYYVTFGMVVGQVLFPVWFFQGMEKMRYIAILNIMARLIFTVSIFIFVRKVSDYIYVPFINSLGSLVAGVWSIWIVFRDFGLRFRLSVEDVGYQLREGGYIFMSTVSYSLYNSTPKFFIGLFIGNVPVAFYSVAERVIGVLRQAINIFFRVFYPYLAKACRKDFKTYAKAWFRLFKFTVCISIILLLFVLFLPERVFIFVFSVEFSSALPILKVLGLSLPLQVLMNLFGMQSMLLLGFTKPYGVSYAIISVLFLVTLPLVLWLSKNVYWVVILILVTEITITIYRALYLHSKGVLYALFEY